MLPYVSLQNAYKTRGWNTPTFCQCVTYGLNIVKINYSQKPCQGPLAPHWEPPLYSNEVQNNLNCLHWNHIDSFPSSLFDFAELSTFQPLLLHRLVISLLHPWQQITEDLTDPHLTWHLSVVDLMRRILYHCRLTFLSPPARLNNVRRRMHRQTASPPHDPLNKAVLSEN